MGQSYLIPSRNWPSPHTAFLFSWVRLPFTQADCLRFQTMPACLLWISLPCTSTNFHQPFTVQACSDGSDFPSTTAFPHKPKHSFMLWSQFPAPIKCSLANQTACLIMMVQFFSTQACIPSPLVHLGQSSLHLSRCPHGHHNACLLGCVSLPCNLAMCHNLGKMPAGSACSVFPTKVSTSPSHCLIAQCGSVFIAPR